MKYIKFFLSYYIYRYIFQWKYRYTDWDGIRNSVFFNSVGTHDHSYAHEEHVMYDRSTRSFEGICVVYHYVSTYNLKVKNDYDS